MIAPVPRERAQPVVDVGQWLGSEPVETLASPDLLAHQLRGAEDLEVLGDRGSALLELGGESTGVAGRFGEEVEQPATTGLARARYTASDDMVQLCVESFRHVREFRRVVRTHDAWSSAGEPASRLDRSSPSRGSGYGRPGGTRARFWWFHRTRRDWFDWDLYPANPDFVVLADPEGNRFCVIDTGQHRRLQSTGQRQLEPVDVVGQTT